MILIAQFPFADLRPFVEGEGSRLPDPAWPAPAPYDSFVRYTGAVKPRPRRGIVGWIGEDKVCFARGALRFTPPFSLRSLAPTALPYPWMAGNSLLSVRVRRLYADGSALGVFTFGVALSRHLGLGPRPFRDIIHGVLDARVEVRQVREGARVPKWKACPFSRADRHLVPLYAAASASSNPARGTEGWWVRALLPFLVLHTRREAHLPEFPHVEVEPYGEAVTIHAVWTAGRDLRMVAIDDRNLPGADLDERYALGRQLRICFGRIHSESRVLKHVLRQVHAGRLAPAAGSEEARRLADYLEHATNAIRRKTDRLIDLTEPEVAEQARAVLEQVEPGDLEGVESLLRRAAPRLRASGIEVDARERVGRKGGVTYTYNTYRIRVSGTDNVIVTGNLTLSGDGQVHGLLSPPTAPDDSDMSPILAPLLQALLAGAVAASKETVGQAIKDGYAALKKLVEQKLGSRAGGRAALEKYPEKPEVWGSALESELEEAGAAADDDLLARARDLLDEIASDPAASDELKSAARVVTQSVYGDRNVTVGGDYIVGGNVGSRPGTAST